MSHHRTPLPIYLKLPTVIVVVGLLIYLKSSLQGFATLFPLVGVVGLYEARKGLWSICRQAPIFTLGMCALLTAAYIAQPLLGLPAALSIGWGMYLIIMLPLTLRNINDARTQQQLVICERSFTLNHVAH